jgi:hypothetical protein
MPVTVKKQGDKYRVIEAASGDIANNAAGTALDGGGHESEEKAKAQARAVNANVEKGIDGLFDLFTEE